jgi:ABC-type branched-subunit amino acid transport system substrate-binding protein
MRNLRALAGFLALAAGLGTAVPAVAQKQYDPGATDAEIKLGQTMPYSGPASAYGTIGRAQAAYFQMLNALGGINGRKLTLISLDDGYNPTKTVEQVRRLVEQEQVLLIFQSLGTAGNTAVQRYLNTQKVPQLFVATGATRFGDPRTAPWTMGWQPSYRAEATVYARHILQTRPAAKIAAIYQNDDYGKDYLESLRAGLGAKADMIVKEASYEITDAEVDSQIVALQASGADTLFIFATSKFASQAIRKTYDIGWRPLIFVNSVSSSVAAVMVPAGLDRAVGVITAQYGKDPTDPQWSKDKAFKDWVEWMKKHYPQGDLADNLNVYAYSVAQTMVQVLKQCGDDLRRENIMRQAANLKNVDLPMLLPGIKLNTSPDDYFPIKQMQLARFDGKRWVLFGPLLTAQGR